jgi:hypothetical protein
MIHNSFVSQVSALIIIHGSMSTCMMRYSSASSAPAIQVLILKREILNEKNALRRRLIPAREGGRVGV